MKETADFIAAGTRLGAQGESHPLDAARRCHPARRRLGDGILAGVSRNPGSQRGKL